MKELVKKMAMVAAILGATMVPSVEVNAFDGTRVKGEPVKNNRGEIIKFKCNGECSPGNYCCSSEEAPE